VAKASTTITRLAQSDWASEQERDSLLAHLIGKPLDPADALLLARHGDPEVAAAGQRLFAARANAGAVLDLIRALPETQANRRGRLVQVLRATPAALVKQVIDDLLHSRLPAERRAAWEAAIELEGPLRSQYLQQAVLAAAPAMRLKALNLLLEERSAQDLHLLLVKLTAAQDPRLALLALRSLAQVRGDDVLAVMLTRFAGDEPEARAIASDYLKREAKAAPHLVRQAMLQGLTHRDQQVRGAASQVLFASGPSDVVVREALQFCGGLLGWLRSRVLSGLVDGGKQVEEAAAGLLDHPDETTRFYALTLAESFDDPELVPAFCRLLRDPDWWIRVTVCDSLARLGDERAVASLIEALDDDEVRWAAIDALGRLGSGASVQPLIERLKDPRDEVRLEVLQGLARLQDARLMPVLMHTRDTDSSLAVRRRASELTDRLVRELGLDADEAGKLEIEHSFELPLERLLHDVRRLGASDLHLTAGEPPLVRIDGVLRPHTGEALPNKEVKELVLSILPAEQQQALLKQGELDFSYELAGVGRYRCSAFLDRKGWSAAYRVVPDTAPTMESLGMPAPLLDIVNHHQGVVAFCGPTGCGKSTSLVAAVNHISERRSNHIITLEDPIEFVHSPKMALINQRELGLHTATSVSGLRAALREDPDVLVIGELREARSIRLAMEAAETGHLVLTTLHCANVTQAVDRLITSFSPEEQDHARSALSETLKFVVCQRLLPKVPPPGRLGIFELLRITPSIANLIRKGETRQIAGLMQLGSALGNRTLDQALLEAVEKRQIRPEDAWGHASKKALFEPLCDPAWLTEHGIRAE
jgi:twitching motility protein PilT